MNTQEDWEDRFDKEFGNPNVFDSSSQWHPAHKGTLYPDIKSFIQSEITKAIEEHCSEKNCALQLDKDLIIKITKSQCADELEEIKRLGEIFSEMKKIIKYKGK